MAPGTAPGLFDRARIVAPPGFNRWLVPPAALAIHLCSGVAYGGLAPAAKAVRNDGDIGLGKFDGVAALAWLAVGLPIAWGVSVALSSAWVLFR